MTSSCVILSICVCACVWCLFCGKVRGFLCGAARLTHDNFRILRGSRCWSICTCKYMCTCRLTYWCAPCGMACSFWAVRVKEVTGLLSASHANTILQLRRNVHHRTLEYCTHRTAFGCGEKVIRRQGPLEPDTTHHARRATKLCVRISCTLLLFV